MSPQNKSIKICNRAVKMARLVKCSLHKCEGLSLIHSTHSNSQVPRQLPVISALM